MDFVDKMPSWLRWLIFFPTGVIASFLIYPLIIIGNRLLSWGEFEGFFGQLFLFALAGGWFGFVFVWVGARIAPKAQFLVAVVLAVILALIMGASLMSRVMLGHASKVSWMELLVSIVAGLIGAIGACHYFYEQDTKAQRDSLNSSVNYQ